MSDAVGLIALPLAFDNQIDQLLILWRFLPHPVPSIVSIVRNFKYLAHHLDRIDVAEAFNDMISQFHLLPTPN
jgi:hypothetical protein